MKCVLKWFLILFCLVQPRAWFIEPLVQQSKKWSKTSWERHILKPADPPQNTNDQYSWCSNYHELRMATNEFPSLSSSREIDCSEPFRKEGLYSWEISKLYALKVVLHHLLLPGEKLLAAIISKLKRNYILSYCHTHIYLSWKEQLESRFRHASEDSIISCWAEQKVFQKRLCSMI